MQLYFLMESKSYWLFWTWIFLKGKREGLTSILDHLGSRRIARINKLSEQKQLKVLTPKQMLQRLPTALAQVKAANTSEN